jgi:hypothetical protein
VSDAKDSCCDRRNLTQHNSAEEAAGRSSASGGADAAAEVHRRVRYLATGGAIASRGENVGRLASVPGDELVGSLRSLPPHIGVSACDVAARGSFAWDSTP